jgi:thiol-disulfide isomerase/thioredoxin
VGCENKKPEEKPVVKQDAEVQKNVETTKSAEVANSTTPDTTKETVEKSAPLFTLETLAGKKIEIRESKDGLIFEAFKDKAVFLLFFGHRCPPCLREIPALIELNKEHDDLEIVAIEVQGLDNNYLKKFQETKGINYNLLSGDTNMDFVGYIQTKANWSGGIPFLVGFNTKGSVGIVHTGGVSKAALEGAYQDLTKGE